MTRSVFSLRYEHLITHLVEARKAAGLTQIMLAKLLDRPQSFVSKVERGERRLDVIEFIDFALACSVDPSTIVERLKQPLQKADSRPV